MMQTIIIPVETKRNCIEKAGKLFCEEQVTTGKEVAYICIFLLLLIGWAMWIAILLSDDNGLGALVVFLAPFIILIGLGFGGYLG